MEHFLIRKNSMGIPCGPVVRTWRFHTAGPGVLSPGGGNKILKAMEHSKNKTVLMKKGKYICIFQRTMSCVIDLEEAETLAP